MSAEIKQEVRRSVLTGLCITLAESRSFQKRPSTKPLRKKEEKYRQESLLALIKTGEDAWGLDLTDEKNRNIDGAIIVKESEESMPCGFCKILFPPDTLIYSPSPTLRWLCPACHDKWKDADPLTTIENPEHSPLFKQGYRDAQHDSAHMNSELKANLDYIKGWDAGLKAIDNPEPAGELPNVCADCEKPLVLRGRAVTPEGETVCYACWAKRTSGTSGQAA